MPHREPSGQLFIVSAPSGVGKSTIIGKVIPNCAKLRFSVSSTTRAARPREIDGKDYHFLSVDEFVQGIRSGRFLEWARVHNHFYGTDRSIVEKWLKGGDDVLLDIDVQGTRLVRCAHPEAETIFVLPPSMEVLEERLRSRGTETEEQLAVRLAAAGREIFESSWYDYIIVNDQLEEAAEDLRAILRARRSSRVARAPEVQAFLMSLLDPNAKS
ncbi:MAG: guanylate kinase [Syntrophobacteraceae bacterium]|nr:guanylate kinase [Syntrophobacteraceae bacterium]